MTPPVNPFAIREAILDAQHGRETRDRALAQQQEGQQIGILSQLMARKQQQEQFAQTQGRLEREQMAQQQFRNAQLQAQGQARRDALTNRPQRQQQLTTDEDGNVLVVTPEGARPLTRPDGTPVKGPKAKAGVTINPAVTVSRVQDPKNPDRLLEVDARTYKGGSVGDVGVIGPSGRESDATKRENKRQFAMQGIGSAIQEAEALLSDKAKPPTQSGIGAAVDYAGSLVGMSPSGAVEAQKLKAVGGALTSKVPRMEGPQSDKDLRLYQEMAGMVGDATIPIDRRVAALDAVKLLWEKYERLNPGTFADRRAGDEPPPGAVRRR